MPVSNSLRSIFIHLYFCCLNFYFWATIKHRKSIKAPTVSTSLFATLDNKIKKILIYNKWNIRFKIDDFLRKKIDFLKRRWGVFWRCWGRAGRRYHLYKPKISILGIQTRSLNIDYKCHRLWESCCLFLTHFHQFASWTLKLQETWFNLIFNPCARNDQLVVCLKWAKIGWAERSNAKTEIYNL